MSHAVLTASGKEQALVDFYTQLKRDGIRGATELAHRAGVGRAYLSRVLNGHETGKNTWKHIMPHISEGALFYLKHCSAWNVDAESAWDVVCVKREQDEKAVARDEEDVVL